MDFGPLGVDLESATFLPLKCFCGTGDIMTPESEALAWATANFRQIRSQEIISLPSGDAPDLKQIAADLNLRTELQA
jgi:hypothetical protein